MCIVCVCVCARAHACIDVYNVDCVSVVCSMGCVCSVDCVVRCVLILC